MSSPPIARSFQTLIPQPSTIRQSAMTKAKKTDPHIVEEETPVDAKPDAVPAVPQEHIEQLDAEEEEFRAMRRDLPGVKGSSAIGIVAIGASKIPGRHEFFRTHRDF